jgi:hypothetical protein
MEEIGKDMRRVVIWGTGNLAKDVVKKLNNDVEIVAFVDNYSMLEFFFEKPVYRPEAAMILEYDFIIICSIYDDEICKQAKVLGIAPTKIVIGNPSNIDKYLVFQHFFFDKRLKELEKKCHLIQLLITGISYHNDGISAKKFNVNAYKFANRSQDIYCDFEMVKYMLKNYHLSSLKYVIIGLNYYSFEYDLSKSSGSWQMLRYYPYICSMHNLISSQYQEEYFVKGIKDLESIRIPKGIFNYDLRNFELNDLEGENAAKADFNKYHPATVFENKRMLEDYMKLLLDNKIKPIFVIMPVTKYYSKYCSASIKKKFYDNLNEVIENNTNIQVLDYFDKMNYPDSYYYHINHMNKRGAVAFTEQLNRDIIWDN